MFRVYKEAADSVRRFLVAQVDRLVHRELSQFRNRRQRHKLHPTERTIVLDVKKSAARARPTLHPRLLLREVLLRPKRTFFQPLVLVPFKVPIVAKAGNMTLVEETLEERKSL